MIHQSGTRLSPKELASTTKNERSETRIVRKFFTETSGKYTAEEVCLLAFPAYDWLKKKTNVRRTLSDLFKDGFLNKSDSDKDKKPGSEGVRLCVYFRAAGRGEQVRLF